MWDNHKDIPSTILERRDRKAFQKMQHNPSFLQIFGIFFPRNHEKMKKKTTKKMMMGDWILVSIFHREKRNLSGKKVWRRNRGRQSPETSREEGPLIMFLIDHQMKSRKEEKSKEMKSTEEKTNGCVFVYATHMKPILARKTLEHCLFFRLVGLRRRIISFGRSTKRMISFFFFPPSFAICMTNLSLHQQYRP